MPIAMLLGPQMTIGRGDRGPGVDRIRLALKQLGYAVEDEEGLFGEHTEQLVYSLQKAFGLEQDGRIDLATAKVLDGLLHAALTLGMGAGAA